MLIPFAPILRVHITLTSRTVLCIRAASVCKRGCDCVSMCLHWLPKTVLVFLFSTHSSLHLVTVKTRISSIWFLFFFVPISSYAMPPPFLSIRYHGRTAVPCLPFQCRPPASRNPKAGEIAFTFYYFFRCRLCHNGLRRQLAVINFPKPNQQEEDHNNLLENIFHILNLLTKRYEYLLFAFVLRWTLSTGHNFNQKEIETGK